MRIKKLSLSGFKSFCDRSTLDFRSPISTIVGPNGCGKSNIVDALRWAMGEQSAKHLRGKSMEDVIFNGSEGRGPSGMAEVAITFQNDGRVPIEYLNYSEITVSRRLHRDGTSEYLINRVPMRLRDVLNLFLGTGVGTKAYSIIEQGRIGLIVSARPEDRRHFIEEAAGITKFQRKKKAAERRIAATKQNLLRVSDVVEEIEKRLGSLKRQAQKAERYRKYREEMRDIELWSASHRMLELMAETHYLSSTQGDRERQREEADAALLKAEADLELARLSTVDLEAKVGRRQEELYSLENQIKLDENNIQHMGHEADDLERRSEEADSEVTELRTQMESDEQELHRAEQEAATHGEHEQELQERVATRERELFARRAYQSEVRAALEAERDELHGAERTQAQGEAVVRALSERRSDLADRMDRRRVELERVDRRREEVETSLVGLDGKLGGLRAGVEEMGQQQTELRERLGELAGVCQKGEQELEVLRTELHRRRSRLASLEEIAKRYEGFARGTRAVMKRLNGHAREEGVLGLVADKLEPPDRYETALEAVLGQRLGTIIVEDEKVGLDNIEFLKSHAEGRSSFMSRKSNRGRALRDAPVGVVWEAGAAMEGQGGGTAASAGMGMQAEGVCGPMLQLINTDPEVAQVAETLLGDVVVVETLDQALDLWDSLEDRTLVTLDGEILGVDGTLTGGSNDAELSGVMRQKREIKELSGIIEELEARYQEVLDQHLARKTEEATLEQRLEQLTRDEHQGDKEIITLEKDLSRLDSERAAMALRREELERESAGIDQLERDADDQERTVQAELQQAERALAVGRDIAALLEQELERSAGLAEAALARVTEAKVELAQAGARLRAAQDAIRRITELSHERRARITRLAASASEGRARAEELRGQVEELEQGLVELVEKRLDSQQGMEQLRSEYDERMQAVTALELEVRAARKRGADLGEGLHQLEVTLSELSLNRRHLEEQIWERYHEELRLVAGDFHLRAPVTAEQLERMEKLRHLIHRMGEINLTAIEEYEELSERHEFLTRQRADLDDALAQLERAIRKINRTSRKRFKETFEKVNKQFQVTFPRLFNGGKARLTLTDPENLLETGVEIIAQPPGKKLQSIDLLSGGEKALTAVSLIFSMFLVKPTPFCLLDEVDAPLDEANVKRFGDMIKEMSLNSQFIIITHNQRTMEIADRLYGVTMEQPGASRLVSVNLQQGRTLVQDD